MAEQRKAEQMRTDQSGGAQATGKKATAPDYVRATPKEDQMQSDNFSGGDTMNTRGSW